jgi:hypothetical protein
MNDFVKRLLACWSGGSYDLDKNCAVTQEIEDLYKKRLRKAKIECYLRLAAAVAIIVYGALGIKYNEGRYIDWALFTAIVGVNAAMMIILWTCHRVVFFTLLKEIKQLQLQIAELAGKESSSEN